MAEAMADRGAILGGEQSGHVIFGSHSTTGDGLVAGLQVLSRSGFTATETDACLG